MIDVIQADASRSTRIRRSSLSGVVQDWLDERELRGADVIRAQVALLVAAQLDADVPPSVVPKLSNERRQTIAEIEGLPTQVDGHQDVRRLLRDVLSWLRTSTRRSTRSSGRWTTFVAVVAGTVRRGAAAG